MRAEQKQKKKKMPDYETQSNKSSRSFVSQGSRHSARMKDSMMDHSKIMKRDSKHSINRICLTGGPCAGKTTALTTLV